MQQKKFTGKVYLKKGQTIHVKIKRLGINGEGIGYYKKKIIFIPGALPKEFVKAKITESNRNYAKAKLLEIVEKSSQRVDPADHYDVGGIELEHLNYDAQLDFKRDVILQALEKFKPRGYEKIKLRKTIGMADPYHYRNKAAFQVRMTKTGKLIAGLYKPESHHLVDLPTFETQRKLTLEIIRKTLALMEKWHVCAYDERTNKGTVKTLVVREAFATNEAQLVFVTNERFIAHASEIAAELRNEFPQLVSVMQNYNPGKTSLVYGDETTRIFGRDYIIEKLGDVSFKLSARAFFQMNPVQTKKMYDEVKQALNLKQGEMLVDAYCGVGTIGLYCGKEAGLVLGMDVVSEAIADAKENAAMSGIKNVVYEEGDAKKIFAKWEKAGQKFDALVVDPPRTGLDDETIEVILRNKPKKFVYVSCNPSTLARDLVNLVSKYDVSYIQPIDMFPQTARTEAVVKLDLRPE